MKRTEVAKAKKAILESIKPGDIFYPSDIAVMTGIDVDVVKQAIKELRSKKRLKLNWRPSTVSPTLREQQRVQQK